MAEKRRLRDVLRERLPERLRMTKGKFALFGMVGVVAGVILGGIGAAALEATDSPEFCSRCHIMDFAFGSFSESNHALLDCNDCHAPAEPWLVKMAFKAQAGTGHIYMNTIGRGDIPDVLHATTTSAEVVNENCARCHAPTLATVSHDVKENCFDCHRSVPHGHGMYRPEEWHEPMHPSVPADQFMEAQP
jgi:cytochrome c nitrite reductase small subunit